MEISVYLFCRKIINEEGYELLSLVEEISLNKYIIFNIFGWYHDVSICYTYIVAYKITISSFSWKLKYNDEHGV